MPSSGSYSFSMNTSSIVTDAMQNIGKLGEGEGYSPQQLTDCTRKLNMIAKQWMGKQDFAPGMKMWTRVRGNLFLSSQKYLYNLGPTGDNWNDSTTNLAYPTQFNTDQLIGSSGFGSTALNVGVGSTGGYNVGDYVGIQSTSTNTTTGPADLFWTSILSVDSVGGIVNVSNGNFSANANAFVFSYTNKGQRPLAIVTALLRDTFSNDTPLNFMTEEDYEYLPSKTQSSFQGDPTAIFYSSQLGNGQLYIDVGGAQDVTKWLHLVYLRPVQDFVNPNDSMDYPIQWANALCWELSKQSAPSYGVQWTETMEQNRTSAIAMAREPDSETSSMYFQCKEYP